MATGVIYYHRFYMKQSFKTFPRWVCWLDNKMNDSFWSAVIKVNFTSCFVYYQLLLFTYMLGYSMCLLIFGW